MDGGQVSIVYDNLYLIEGLTENLESIMQQQGQKASPWLLRLLFNLSENERRRLAADLHDSALQDQLVWYRRLEIVMQDIQQPSPLHTELSLIKEGLLDVIHQIRETCNELRPPLLREMGIVRSLELLFEEMQLRTNYAIQFQAHSFSRDLNDEQILVLYRIVQELLRNAVKHAKATQIEIELEERQTQIYFRYRDDGIGLDLQQVQVSFQHMGLSGIQERVASLEGNITFQSEQGEGLEVLITLPVLMGGSYESH